MWRDRRVKDVAKAGDVLALLRAVRSFGPQLGEFGSAGENSVAIASNESFGGWTKTFTDPRLCAAIVDRLTFNGTIVETGTDSCRLASTRALVGETAKVG